MTSKKKILISLIVILILIIGFFIFSNKSTETVLETYTLNQQGLMRSEKIILDERFDENGNLIYYKCRSPYDYDIYEFNFKYKYDDSNRITEVSLDDKDYIQIEYDKNNKISKINESISDSLSNNTNFIQFSFNYLSNDELMVDKNITNSKDSENAYIQHYTLNYKDIDYNNRKCILLTEKDDKGVNTFEILYEKNVRNIDYSNVYELINIIPLGYSTVDNSFKYTSSYDNSLLLLYPVIFNGNIIYTKNYMKIDPYSDYEEMGSKKYYDSMNRLLKQESNGCETNQTINCMYKSINSKEYYEYRLIKIYSNSSTEYRYIQNKIYLDDNNQIYKKEILQSDKIDEKEYNSKLKKFEKYFQKENV